MNIMTSPGTYQWSIGLLRQQQQQLTALVLVSTLVVISQVVDVNGQSYCYQTDPDPNTNHSTWTAYTPGDGYQPVHTYPQGCRPIQLWTIARHGTRYVSAEEMASFETNLDQLREDILQNATYGDICLEDLSAITAWDFRMQPEDSMRLVDPVGYDEIRGLGQRFAAKFPELLTGGYIESVSELRHTNFTGQGDRTKETARAFAQGYFGSDEGVELVEQSSPDFLLRAWEDCERYRREVADQPIPEYDNFEDMDFTQDMLRVMEDRLGLATGSLTLDYVTDNLYYICRVEWDVYKDSPWCAAFLPEDIDLLEYREDVKYYWKELYGDPINYRMACPILADVFDAMEPRIANQSDAKRLLSRFTHSPTMHIFFARLGFFQDPEPLRAEDYYQQSGREFRTTQSTPQGSNLAFVLYECDDDVFRIETFINEVQVSLPGCGFQCPFDQFSDMYKTLANNCDIEAYCAV